MCQDHGRDGLVLKENFDRKYYGALNVLQQRGFRGCTFHQNQKVVFEIPQF